MNMRFNGSRIWLLHTNDEIRTISISCKGSGSYACSWPVYTENLYGSIKTSRLQRSIDGLTLDECNLVWKPCIQRRGADLHGEGSNMFEKQKSPFILS